MLLWAFALNVEKTFIRRSRPLRPLAIDKERTEIPFAIPHGWNLGFPPAWFAGYASPTSDPSSTAENGFLLAISRDGQPGIFGCEDQPRSEFVSAAAKEDYCVRIR